MKKYIAYLICFLQIFFISNLSFGELVTPATDANLVTTDITNNNVSTTKHGFVPKGTNVGNFLKDDGTWSAPSGSGDMLLASPQTVTGAKTFLNGALIINALTSGQMNLKASAVSTSGDITLPATAGTLATLAGTETLTNKSIAETQITFTDNTTGDVSTSNHGFMSKLPAPSGLFYRDDGTWAAAGGGSGDMILASSQTVTGAKIFEPYKFILSGNTGELYLNGPATATSQTITFQDVTGTVMMTSATQTIGGVWTGAGNMVVSNTTLNSSILTGATALSGDTTFNANMILHPTDSSITGANAVLTPHPTPIARLTNASLTSVGSIDNAATLNGHFLYVHNDTGATITIVNNYSGAAAGQTIKTNYDEDVQVKNGVTILFVYDGIDQYWSMVSVVDYAAGQLNAVTKNSQGLSVSSTSIYLQTADATFPGIMSSGTQTIAGIKTFSGSVSNTTHNDSTLAGLTTITNVVSGTATWNGVLTGANGGTVSATIFQGSSLKGITTLFNNVSGTATWSGVLTGLNGGTVSATKFQGSTIAGQTTLSNVMTGGTISGTTLSSPSVNGILTMNAGAGISFPTTEVATTSATVLNDYEKGNWTPTVSATTGNGAGTYSVQTGRYTKIGDRICVNGYVLWTAAPGSGNAVIAGLPYASTSTANMLVGNMLQGDEFKLSGSQILNGYVNVNASTIQMIGVSTASVSATAAPIQPHGEVLIGGCYVAP